MRSWTDRISAFVQSAEFWRAFADRRSSSTWREASSYFCSETSRSTSFQEGGADGVGVGVRIADTAAGFFWGPGAAAHAMAASAAAIATPTHRPDARMAVILPTEEPARPEKFLGSAPSGRHPERFAPSSRAERGIPDYFTRGAIQSGIPRAFGPRDDRYAVAGDGCAVTSERRRRA